MTESDVRKLVIGAIERAGGVRALAQEWGVSPSQISDVANRRRGPGPKILRNLGMVRVRTVRFVKAG